MRSNLLASYRDIAGVLCCWSASAMNGMSGSYDWNWSYYADISIPIKATSMTIFPFPPEPIETHTVGLLTVTTPYITLIDLIRWDCEIEFVFQALDWWERTHRNLDVIWMGLEERDLMQKYLQEYAPYRDEWVDVY